ncbi:uncharacterized protein SGFS_038290 [Streptomyces graminofaciens]|uniref:Uncharacterized protein n=1 Tax=Streptomyces graminofaciens TaxID=68212 RepID=A0ABM7F985_9ACTN|nr:hypothetical protein [Streptomyces graminofaciens]BBC32535.1 uncharacterized protein SGFS_038290 [Streptomyces graminofaciens]
MAVTTTGTAGVPGTPDPATGHGGAGGFGSGEPGPGVGARVRERIRAGFGLVGPRHGRHALSLEQVDSLALPIGDDGVVIGVDAEGQPAVLGINRPTPYDVVLIGGLWTAQVLALRAAATGARVAVETGRAQAWMQMVHAMGGGQNGMAVYDVGRVPPQGASAGGPVLVVRDCGMRPPRGRVVAGPWQSVLTLLPYLSPVAPRLIRQARLVGVQRVSPDEAAELGRAMALPRGDVDSLPTLADGVTLWCADRDRQYVMTQPTDAEIGLLGTPRRMD